MHILDGDIFMHILYLAFMSILGDAPMHILDSVLFMHQMLHSCIASEGAFKHILDFSFMHTFDALCTPALCLRCLFQKNDLATPINLTTTFWFLMASVRILVAAKGSDN